MIRLTILYNLREDQDEQEFLKWRLGEHQENNASMPGVTRTDFGQVYETYPRDKKPRYRYMTIAEFPDKETLDAAFWGDGDMAGLEESLTNIGEYEFFIAEILISAQNE